MTTSTPDPAALSTARHFSLKHRRAYPEPDNLGDWLADRIAAVVGSWTFITVQSAVLALWIVLNVIAWVGHWDPYPFILLNLVLSFQAAFTAPILMMAQNRQADIDRQKAELDYDVNLKAELDIEALHQKVDLLRQQDIARLIGLIETLTRERIEREDQPG